MLSENLKNIEKCFDKWKTCKSSRELSCIQPRILAKDLNISEGEADNFLSILVERGQALRVFSGICPNSECNEEFSIDSSQIDEKYECDMCGTSFKITDDLIEYIEVYYELIEKSNEYEYSGSINYKKKYFTKKLETSNEKVIRRGYSSDSNVIDFNETLNSKNVEKNKDGESDISVGNKKDTDLSIFISHNEKDHDLAETIIQFLEALGISNSDKDKKIFCSSVNNRGVSIGEDIFEKIRVQFNDNIIVIFLFTENFFSSPACLCEMGAAWVKSKSVVPLVMPPQKFEEIKGIFNTNIKGYMLDNKEKFAELMEYFTEKFHLQTISFMDGERIKKSFFNGIENYKNSIKGTVD